MNRTSPHGQAAFDSGTFARQLQIYSQSTSRTQGDEMNASTSAASMGGGSAVDNTLDFSDIQFNDETFLEDVLLCQFTYNPSGLTIPSTPTASTMPMTNIGEYPENISPLNGDEPSHEVGVGVGQKPNVSSNSAVQITPDELELFHANMTIADGGGDLAHFKKPSLSRTSRCIIAYFQHFDPHAPFVHYASFNVSKAHR